LEQKLTAAEADQLASLLKRATWPVPLSVFYPLMAFVPTNAIELVVIVDDYFATQPRVMLFPRPDSDPFFAGMVHSAGVVVMRGDTEASALARVMTKELGGTENVSQPRFVGNIFVPMGPLPDGNPRGQEIGHVYYTRWDRVPLPDNAMLCDPDALPDNIIGFHRNIIEMAVDKYREDFRVRRDRP